jgi:hypothetical protein
MHDGRGHVGGKSSAPVIGLQSSHEYGVERGLRAAKSLLDLRGGQMSRCRFTMVWLKHSIKAQPSVPMRPDDVVCDGELGVLRLVGAAAGDEPRCPAEG